MKILVGRDYNEFSKLAAKHVAKFIRANPNRLLCFAAGDTPIGIYEELIKMQKCGELNLNTMYFVGLDEWVGIGYETKGSCAQVMQDFFYGPANIDTARIRVFDGLAADLEKECEQVDRWITEKGAISFTLLGIGMNGHIGFNEPGTDPERLTHAVELDEVTADVGKKYFDGAACPAQGITVGIKRLKEAEKIILTACGDNKGAILKKTLIEAPTTEVPSSLLQDHGDLTVVTDVNAFRAMW